MGTLDASAWVALQKLRTLLDSRDPVHRPFSMLCSRLHQQSEGQAEAERAIALALALWRQQEHLVVVRCVGGSAKYWVRNMSGLFLVVRPYSSFTLGAQVDYIVDPGFKDKFRIAHMTPRYRTLWDLLPEIFIGQPATLTAVVQLLASEMEVAFDSSALTLPPWRKLGLIYSCWLSATVEDVQLPRLASTSIEEDRQFTAKCYKLLRSNRGHPSSSSSNGPHPVPASSGKGTRPGLTKPRLPSSASLSSLTPQPNAPPCTLGFNETHTPQPPRPCRHLPPGGLTLSFEAPLDRTVLTEFLLPQARCSPPPPVVYKPCPPPVSCSPPAQKQALHADKDAPGNSSWVRSTSWDAGHLMGTLSQDLEGKPSAQLPFTDMHPRHCNTPPPCYVDDLPVPVVVSPPRSPDQECQVTKPPEDCAGPGDGVYSGEPQASCVVEREEDELHPQHVPCLPSVGPNLASIMSNQSHDHESPAHLFAMATNQSCAVTGGLYPTARVNSSTSIASMAPSEFTTTAVAKRGGCSTSGTFTSSFIAAVAGANWQQQRPRGCGVSSSGSSSMTAAVAVIYHKPQKQCPKQERLPGSVGSKTSSTRGRRLASSIFRHLRCGYVDPARITPPAEASTHSTLADLPHY